MGDAALLVEDQFERIEVALDRLGSRRPNVDLDSIGELERQIVGGIELTYQTSSMPNGSTRLPQVKLRMLRRWHRDWLVLLRRLGTLDVGSSRWWTRLDYLDNRIRQQCREFESEVIGC